MSDLFTSFGENEDMIDRDAFITNFMVYWFSARQLVDSPYYEDMHDPNAWTPKENSGVPTGVAVSRR